VGYQRDTLKRLPHLPRLSTSELNSSRDKLRAYLSHLTLHPFPVLDEVELSRPRPAQIKARRD
jgi:hypothetical protein